MIETLLRAKEVAVDAAEAAWQALRSYAGSSADFADCPIERMCHGAPCEYTVTLDANASKATGVRLIK